MLNTKTIESNWSYFILNYWGYTQVNSHSIIGTQITVDS